MIIRRFRKWKKTSRIPGKMSQSDSDRGEKQRSSYEGSRAGVKDWLAPLM